MATQVDFGIAQYFGFDPRTIAGCRLWLDATDTRTIQTSGTAVTSWTDKVSNAVMTTRGTTANATLVNQINGRQTIYFNNTAAESVYMDGSLSSIITGNAFYAFQAINQRTAAFRPFATWFTNGGTFPAYGYVNTGTSITAPYTTFVGIGSPTAVLTAGSNYVLSYGWTGTTTNVTRDGSNVVTGSQPAYSSSTTTFWIGADGSGAAVRTSLYYGEMIFYDSVLSRYERQQVEGYLAWKWGTTSTIPTGHSFNTIPPTMRVFQPFDIANCILWLDGADSRTVGVSGTNVTAWNDKSGLGNNLTTISATAPTYSSSTGAITFTSQNGTAIRGALNASYGATVSSFVVCSITSNTNAIFLPRLLNFGTSGASATYLVGQFNVITSANTGTTPGFATYVGNGLNPTGQGTNVQTYIPTSFATVRLFENISTYSGSSLSNNTFLNGNTSTFSSINTTFTLASPYVSSFGYVSLGNYTNGAAVAGDCFSGDIYEVIVYSSNITTQQRQQVEGYLTAKWGLNSLLPTTQPYQNVKALPSTPVFLPTQISNCALWIDAADSSRITFSGSNVRLITDKSGNTNTAINNVLSSTVLGPTVTSSNTLLFTRTSSNVQGLNTQTNQQTTQAVTFAIVAKPSQDVSAAIWLDFRKTAGGIPLHTFYNNQIVVRGSTPATLASYPQTISSTNFSIFHLQTTANNLIFSLNGTVTTSNTNTLDMPAADSRWLTIGCLADITGQTLANMATFTCTSEIAEVIMINRFVTSAERQKLEGYLAWKWGLQNSLPTTHPYYKFRP
jgi:hypothetical protein